jgi:hypothetical protein
LSRQVKSIFSMSFPRIKTMELNARVWRCANVIKD